MTLEPGLLHVYRQHPVGISLDEVRVVSSLGCRHGEPTGHHFAWFHLRDGNSFRLRLIQQSLYIFPLLGVLNIMLCGRQYNRLDQNLRNAVFSLLIVDSSLGRIIIYLEGFIVLQELLSFHLWSLSNLNRELRS